jgi:hypothetical protein
MAISYQGPYDQNYEYHCRRCYEQCRPNETLCLRCKGYVAPSSTIDAQLAGAEQRVLELLARKDAMAKFGSDSDYGVDDAILFKRKFATSSKTYTYVAVRTPVGWYITGKDALNGMTFETLVSEHLIYAKEVWACAEWRQIC